MMGFRKDQPDGLTFVLRSPDDILKKIAWETDEYCRLQTTIPQDWQGMVYTFINGCITLTSLVDWYAKLLSLNERALAEEAATVVDGFVICKAIANTTKHGSYRCPKDHPLAAVGLGRTMSPAEIAMEVNELIEYNDNTVFHDWKVSVQTGRGQFYGDDFLRHITTGLISFGAAKGVASCTVSVAD